MHIWQNSGELFLSHTHPPRVFLWIPWMSSRITSCLCGMSTDRADALSWASWRFLRQRAHRFQTVGMYVISDAHTLLGRSWLKSWCNRFFKHCLGSGCIWSARCLGFSTSSLISFMRQHTVFATRTGKIRKYRIWEAFRLLCDCVHSILQLHFEFLGVYFGRHGNAWTFRVSLLTVK